MKRFKSFLAPEFEECLAWRLNMGFKGRCFQDWLQFFDRYVIEAKADWHDFTPEFFLTYQSRVPGQNRTVNLNISAIQSFFKFLVRKEVVKHNPLQDIPPRPEPRFIPFIFSPREVDQLLVKAGQRIRREEKYFFRDYTVATALMLLARCGLRISEPLALTVDSFCRDDNTIYIRKTKFHKDRLIPVPKGVAMELKNYLMVRSRFLEAENPYLFPSVFPGKGLTPGYIYPLFSQVVEDIGINRKKQIIGSTIFGAPVVHSLRHSFAVNTLKQTANPQNVLPILSAYMGHRKYGYTAIYLKMLDADQRNNLVDFSMSHREEQCG